MVMTILTQSTILAGSYTVTVNGTSGSLRHSASVSLIVTSGGGTGTSPDFQLTISQAFTVTDSNTARTAKVSINPNYTGSLNTTCDHSAIPASQCIITPANPIAIKANVPLSLAVNLNLPNNAMPGTYNINLTVAD